MSSIVRGPTSVPLGGGRGLCTHAEEQPREDGRRPGDAGLEGRGDAATSQGSRQPPGAGRIFPLTSERGSPANTASDSEMSGLQDCEGAHACALSHHAAITARGSHRKAALRGRERPGRDSLQTGQFQSPPAFSPAHPAASQRTEGRPMQIKHLLRAGHLSADKPQESILPV